MNPRTLLFLDDDPTHLKLYGWIVRQAGYSVHASLVASLDFELPAGSAIDLVIMDYNFGSLLTARQVADKVTVHLPGVPILVLSDHNWMPADMAPLAAGFVRKGDPELLVQTIYQMVPL